MAINFNINDFLKNRLDPPQQASPDMPFPQDTQLANPNKNIGDINKSQAKVGPVTKEATNPAVKGSKDLMDGSKNSNTDLNDTVTVAKPPEADAKGNYKVEEPQKESWSFTGELKKAAKKKLIEVVSEEMGFSPKAQDTNSPNSPQANMPPKPMSPSGSKGQTNPKAEQPNPKGQINYQQPKAPPRPQVPQSNWKAPQPPKMPTLPKR